MPPVTRSSVQGSMPVAEEQSSPPAEIESDSHGSMDEDDELVFDQDDVVPFQTSTQEILQPLQDTANRVSRQVEEFAKKLDQFNADRSPEDHQLWTDAWALLAEYRRIASQRHQHTVSKSPKSTSRRSLGDSKSQVEKIQLEADLWELIKDLLVCSSPKTEAYAEVAQQGRLSELHRYSTNSELWQAFLDSDTTAQGYECCLDWLQKRAEKTRPPVNDVISTLIEQSERGAGPWQAGPIFTKGIVKKQRRDRAWPVPLEPANPGVQKSLRRSTDNTRVVAQLDPDAPFRENASLEPQDEAHEAAAWQACWELLRRGQPSSASRQYWAAQKEQWRLAAIQSCDSTSNEKLNSPWARIMNLATNTELLSRCKALCQSDVVSDEYQSAVYGVICGELSVSQSVCQTIDDNLFAIFNALLIGRFQHFLASYKSKLEDPGLKLHTPQPASAELIQKYLNTAQADNKTKDEIHHAHKYIEMAVVGQDFESFFIQLGQAAAHVAHDNGEFAHLMERNDAAPRDDFAQITAQDEDSVRIVVHLQLLLRSLGLLDQAYQHNLRVMENNIANYIGWLQKSKKWSLIPLYASHLSKDRAQRVLGAILINVTDPREQDFQVKLLKHYKVNVADALYGIFYLANYQDIQAMLKGYNFAAPRITEREGTGKVEQIKIRSEFMEGELTPQEQKSIASVQWYRFISAEEWGRACWSISSIYKHWLAFGKFAALKALLAHADLGQMSLKTFSMNLKFADDYEEAPDSGDANMEEMDLDMVTPLSPTKRKRTQQNEHPLLRGGTSREALHEKALVWLQLEQLVTALQAFERWQDMANYVEANRSNNKMALVNKARGELRSALEDVRTCMVPLLDNDFLCKAHDDLEEACLKDIRTHYLPECILAYNSALYYAGHAISRSKFVDCMELAQVVASTPTLTRAFVDSKRMRELVTCFALDSQAMLRANEESDDHRQRKAKKIPKMDIWEVKWNKELAIDLQELV